MAKPMPTVRMGNLGNMVKSTDPISAAQQIIEKEKVEEKTLVLAEDTGVRGNLAEAVQNFAALMKTEGLFFANTMVLNMKVLEIEDTLRITLTNQRDVKQFDEIKSRFLEFLNKETGKVFKLETAIEKIENAPEKVYTNKDKLLYMADKHPFIIEFAKGLDLELG